MILNPEFNETQWEEICISVVENATTLGDLNYKYDPDGEGYRYVFDYGTFIDFNTLTHYANNIIQEYPRAISEFLVHLRIVDYEWRGRSWHVHFESYCQKCSCMIITASNMSRVKEIAQEHYESHHGE